jgi:hypothetical protein
MNKGKERMTRGVLAEPIMDPNGQGACIVNFILYCVFFLFLFLLNILYKSICLNKIINLKNTHIYMNKIPIYKITYFRENSNNEITQALQRDQSIK